jgi:hypothetical protein
MRGVRGLVALGLMVLAGCRGDRNPQTQPTSAGGAGSLRDAGGSANAPIAVDAAAPPVDAPAADAASDASVAALPAWPVAPGADVPEFGCIGWSRKRGVLACILGTSFSDTGLSTALTFVTIRPDAEAIEPLVLVEQPGRSRPPFPPDKIAPFNDLLRGFMPIDRSAPRLEAAYVGDKLVVGPALTAGGAKLSLELERDGTMIYAPKYRATLWIRFPGQPRVMIEQVADAISHVEARVFAVGSGAVIVERIYSTGDEGTYGTYIRLWQCATDRCDDAG